MQRENKECFYVERLLNSCSDLEKSYGNLLNEKREIQLKLVEATNCLNEIKEKYDQERKNNLQLSSIISEKTDKLINEQNYHEQYENAKKEIEIFKRKIELLKKENDIEKDNLSKQLKLLEKIKQEKVQEAETKMEMYENKIQQLQTELTEHKLELEAQRKHTKQLEKLLINLGRKDDLLLKLEHDKMLNGLIKKHQNARKKIIKDCITEQEIEIGDNIVTDINDESKAQQKEYEYIEKELNNIKYPINTFGKEKKRKAKSDKDEKKKSNKMYYKI